METRLDTIQIYWQDCYDNHWTIVTNPPHTTSDYIVCIFRAFWELEKIPTITSLSQEVMECEKHFLDTHYRNACGQYVVQLPFHKSSNLLGQSKQPVISTFQRNETQLMKDQSAKTKYNAFMQEYLSLHHMQLVSQKDRDFPYPNCLPHHVTSKLHDPTAKTKVVFNGFFCMTSGVLFLKYGSSFRDGIIIESSDCNLQRIIWRSDPSEPLQEYNLTTVTYGTRPAPFLVTRVLQQSSIKYHYHPSIDSNY